jgi:hypothetical protein
VLLAGDRTFQEWYPDLGEETTASLVRADVAEYLGHDGDAVHLELVKGGSFPAEV